MLYGKPAASERGGCKNKVHGCLQEIDRDGVNCKHARDHCKERKDSKCERGEPCHFCYFMLSKIVLEDAAALLAASEIAGMPQFAWQALVRVSTALPGTRRECKAPEHFPPAAGWAGNRCQHKRGA